MGPKQYSQAELDVGPIFLTRPTSEVIQPDPTQNLYETLDPTQPTHFVRLLAVEKYGDILSCEK